MLTNFMTEVVRTEITSWVVAQFPHVCMYVDGERVETL